MKCLNTIVICTLKWISSMFIQTEWICTVLKSENEKISSINFSFLFSRWFFKSITIENLFEEYRRMTNRINECFTQSRSWRMATLPWQAAAWINELLRSSIEILPWAKIKITLGRSSLVMASINDCFAWSIEQSIGRRNNFCSYLSLIQRSRSDLIIKEKSIEEKINRSRLKSFIYDEAFGWGFVRFLVFASQIELTILFPIERITCTKSDLFI